MSVSSVRILPIIHTFAVLLLFQAAGTTLRALMHSSLPGPLLGMVLLAVWLLFFQKRPFAALEKTADGLLGWLALFFVPAGAGVLSNLELLRSAWLPLLIGLIGSTLLTIAATALVMHLARLSRRGEGRA